MPGGESFYRFSNRSKVIYSRLAANSPAAISLRIAASEESLPTVFGGVVSLLLIDQFAMSRAKANVNPPAAIPEITGANT
jgi:hypothetical protein